MLNKRRAFLILLCFTFFGCASIDVINVSNVVKKPSYEINSWQTVKIKTPESIIHIKPCNDLTIGYGDQYFPLLPIEKNKKINPYYYYIYYEKYYGDKYATVSAPPPFFYLEILFAPRQEGLSFNPLDVNLIIAKKIIPANAYIAPEGFFSGGWGIRLIPYETIKEYLNSEQTVSQNFLLYAKEKRGFAIKFDIPPPEPGTSFSIQINGLTYQGESLKLPFVEYAGVKQIKDYRVS